MKISDWYDDTTFVVHAYMKIHTGGVLTTGKGEIQTIPMEQKLNTKSYTKT